MVTSCRILLIASKRRNLELSSGPVHLKNLASGCLGPLETCNQQVLEMKRHILFQHEVLHAVFHPPRQ